MEHGKMKIAAFKRRKKEIKASHKQHTMKEQKNQNERKRPKCGENERKRAKMLSIAERRHWEAIRNANQRKINEKKLSKRHTNAHTNQPTSQPTNDSKSKVIYDNDADDFTLHCKYKTNANR